MDIQQIKNIIQNNDLVEINFDFNEGILEIKTPNSYEKIEEFYDEKLFDEVKYNILEDYYPHNYTTGGIIVYPVDFDKTNDVVIKIGEIDNEKEYTKEKFYFFKINLFKDKTSEFLKQIEKIDFFFNFSTENKEINELINKIRINDFERVYFEIPFDDIDDFSGYQDVIIEIDNESKSLRIEYEVLPDFLKTFKEYYSQMSKIINAKFIFDDLNSILFFPIKIDKDLFFEIGIIVAYHGSEKIFVNYTNNYFYYGRFYFYSLNQIIQKIRKHFLGS